MTIYTIGHSTRSLEELVEALRGAGIVRVADVRTVPRSRRNPQFNQESLPAELAKAEIAYSHLAGLGGLRGRRKDLAAGESPNGGWENDAFRNYADYALTKPFRDALGELEELGGAAPTVIMCAEALWWSCHRRIISDYLTVRGWSVLHLMPPGKPRPHTLTAFAAPQKDGAIFYAAHPESA